MACSRFKCMFTKIAMDGEHRKRVNAVFKHISFKMFGIKIWYPLSHHANFLRCMKSMQWDHGSCIVCMFSSRTLTCFEQVVAVRAKVRGSGRKPEKKAMQNPQSKVFKILFRKVTILTSGALNGWRSRLFRRAERRAERRDLTWRKRSSRRNHRTQCRG